MLFSFFSISLGLILCWFADRFFSKKDYLFAALYGILGVLDIVLGFTL